MQGGKEEGRADKRRQGGVEIVHREVDRGVEWGRERCIGEQRERGQRGEMR